MKLSQSLPLGINLSPVNFVNISSVNLIHIFSFIQLTFTECLLWAGIPLGDLGVSANKTKIPALRSRASNEEQQTTEIIFKKSLSIWKVIESVVKGNVVQKRGHGAFNC